jgi:hypothetical protein
MMPKETTVVIAGLTRQSIVFEEGWMRGSSRALTEQSKESRHAEMEHDHRRRRVHELSAVRARGLDEYVGNDWPGWAAPMPKHGHKWINILQKEGQMP